VYMKTTLSYDQVFHSLLLTHSLNTSFHSSKFSSIFFTLTVLFSTTFYLQALFSLNPNITYPNSVPSLMNTQQTFLNLSYLKNTLSNISFFKAFFHLHSPLYFHYTNIANFYWSFILLPFHTSTFVFSLTDPLGILQTFHLICFPFG
jgi:hypothetical protein